MPSTGSKAKALINYAIGGLKEENLRNAKHMVTQGPLMHFPLYN